MLSKNILKECSHFSRRRTVPKHEDRDPPEIMPRISQHFPGERILLFADNVARSAVRQNPTEVSPQDLSVRTRIAKEQLRPAISRERGNYFGKLCWHRKKVRLARSLINHFEHETRRQ